MLWLKIVICDDDKQYLEDLKIHIEEYMNNRLIHFTIDAATNPNEILNNNTVYNLAFLDIRMDEMSGISLAKELKRRNNKVILFFITSFNKYQDDAMDLRAFRFFEKPFNSERLYSGLDKAMEYIDEAYVDIYQQSGISHIKLLVDDIICIERNNRKSMINTVNEQYTTKDSLEKWCELLPNSFFYRVHKSFFVNLHYVEHYNYSELFLSNGMRIPIASRKQSDFHKYWFTYLRRR